MKSKNRKATVIRPHAADRKSDIKSGRDIPGCLIVGVGASAGGLEAFTRLLKYLPGTTGLGFVFVQHLDPQHESALTHILARQTTMPVTEVTNNLRVEANHVYIIPPNRSLRVAKGVLELHPRLSPRTGARSIDSFFESLAQDQGGSAIGVILSGTASDGTLGLEAIKAEGGITFAQDDSAAYDSMPRSAAGAGCVDFVLSPQGIAEELTRIAKHPYVASRTLEFSDSEKTEKAAGTLGTETALPARGGGRGAKKVEARVTGDTEFISDTASGSAHTGFQKILAHLRKHTGVDFSLYKTPTIHRRIARRMVLNRHETPEIYADFLRGNAKELDALYSDALISVTSFFRNAEAFEVLQQKVFPKLLQQRGDCSVRVWVLGCSTGQEAYSLAMILTEAAEKASRACKIQVFATDLNEANLHKARLGLYAKSVVEDVSPARLRRFFVEEEGGFRVIKPLRELVIFARQNLITDPPFSRMDLISCRNLMIYLEPSLQKKALPTFHYALKPEGFLFLGASESVGTFTDLFEPVDKKQKIFSRKAAQTVAFDLPVRLERRAEFLLSPRARSSAALAKRKSGSPEGFYGEHSAEREADRVAVHKFAPPGVLINEGLQILQFRGPTSPYLTPAQGKPSFDLLKMAREGLMLPLRAAVNRAKKENKTARTVNVPFQLNGKHRKVNLEVVPLKNLQERCFLVSFEEPRKAGLGGLIPQTAEPEESGPHRPKGTGNSNGSASLERELAETKDYLQSVQEQHEVAAEELQASHEESQSANEELQSINEEMETSKEELESTNEELTTVNEEMANRNTELNRLNSDLTNLQTSTKLVIMLLGRDLTLRRFSRQAEKQFNLLPTDVGRPLGNIRHNLDIPDLESLIGEVVTSVRERECEVRDKQGHWHALHVRPYLTSDNKVDGAVLVLVDITAIKETEQAVIAERDFAEAIISTARDPLLILDANLRVERANESFYTTFNVTQAESIGRTVFELDHGHWDIPKLRQLLLEIVPRHSFFNNFEVTHDFERIGRRTMLLNARTLGESKGRPARILLGIQDISELLHLQAQMRHSELRFRRLFEAGKDGVLLVDPGTRKIIDANPFMTELLGYPRDALIGKELFEIGLLKDEEESRAAFHQLQKRGFMRYENLPLETKAGLRREVEFVSNLYQEGGGQVIQCNIRDVTVRKRTERELSEKARLLDLSNDAIIVCDLDDSIRLWNKGAENLYGWSAEEVLGKPCRPLLQTEFSKPNEVILARFHRDGEFHGEVVQTARNGKRVPALCRWVLDKGTESILTSYTDITERKAAEIEMAQERDKAIGASGAKDSFIAALSHELRTPLNPVLLIATDGASDPTHSPEARAAFGTIAKNALLEARLIDDLLDLTKVTHGKMPLELQRVDLNAALRDAITTLGSEFEEKKIGIILKLAPDPCAVTADPVRLQQVFWNVLSNALKFTPSGGTVEILTQLNPARNEIIVAITDSGIGMTPDELRRIFVAFSQGDHVSNTGSRRFGGVGLGLAISQKIVQLHAGRISATSEGRDHGTTFSIAFPLASESNPTKSDLHSLTPWGGEGAIALKLTKRNILLVEDDEATRISLVSMLGRRGHQVMAASSVAEAIAHAETHQFDLVVSDIGLPDGDGCDLMLKLHEQHALKGIAMTGYGMEEDVLRSRESGFVTHLTKPVSIQTLDAAIASFG
jgi:two-component system CheB/CheR fusion protein